MNGKDWFASWYNNMEDINLAFREKVSMCRSEKEDFGVYSYTSTRFFPINGKGFDKGMTRNNNHFTTEITYNIKYEDNDQ